MRLLSATLQARKERTVVVLLSWVVLVILVALTGSADSQKLSADSPGFATLRRASVTTTRSMNKAATAVASPRGGSSASTSGRPWINLREGVELSTAYIADAGLKQVLEQNLAVPLALASADFDEDGVPDLVSGYAGPGGGLITLHRGNVDSIFPNTSEARQRRAQGQFVDSPFYHDARVFEVAASPEFIGTGDFDADGHWDVVTTARGSDALVMLPGNGRGGFGKARRIDLPGRVTAMVTGEINRRDGLDDVIVGIVGRDGPRVLVFEWPEGALRGEPEAIPVPAEATALALGQLDDTSSASWQLALRRQATAVGQPNDAYAMDLVVAAGSELLIVHGRDRRLSLDEIRRAEVKPATIDQRSFPFTIRSLALGDFVWDEAHQTDIALLADDGAIHILAKPQPSVASASVRAALRGRPRLADGQNAGAHGEAPVQPSERASVRVSVSGRPRLANGQNAGAHGEAPVQPSEQVSVRAAVPGRPRLADGQNAGAHGEAPIQASERVSVRAAAPGRPRLADGQNAGAHRGDTFAGASVFGRPRLADGQNAGAHGEAPVQPSERASVRVSVSGHPRFDPMLEEWQSEILTTDSWPQATRLIRAKTSSLPTDDLLILDGADQELHILTTGDEPRAQSAIQCQAKPVWRTKSAIAAVLPIRLNVDALNDLVLLKSGQSAPTLAMTMAVMTFTVNSTADDDDGDCNGASGDCTLREAINAANANSGLDTIEFNIGAGTPTITLASSLPTITNPVTINGNTGGATRVEVIGNGPPYGPPYPGGLAITAGSSTVRAMVINRLGGSITLVTNGSNIVENCLIGTNAAGTASLAPFNGDGVGIYGSPDNLIGGTTVSARNVISGNARGVRLVYSGSTMNQVQGNLIGTDVAGSAALANLTEGVTIQLGASNNTIGGTVAGARNVISGNNAPGTVAGILIEHSATTMNLVQGNYIGTDVTGTGALGNNGHSVRIEGGSSSNLIGGTTAAARNVIWGGCGVLNSPQWGGPTTTLSQVQGNFIGTDFTGTADLGNIFSGVAIQGGASSNTIGGIVAAARNVISGNGAGVSLSTSGYGFPTMNQVQGNFIGTDFTGTIALGNGNGVVIASGAFSNTIGGTDSGARNVISGNKNWGVVITNANYVGGPDLGATTINQVQGNYIGTAVNGTAALGNSNSGMLITTPASNNTIGGTASGAGNIIAFNGGAGVRMDNTGGTGNAFRRNSIHDNGGLGIDLGPAGVTANDVGDGDSGPNNLQNFPVLTSATSGGGNTTIMGTLNSTANTSFTLEFFANSAADPSCFGEGQTFIGSTNVTTDGSGNASINVTFPTGVPLGQVITSTATDPNGNTSEFSGGCVGVTPPSNQPPVAGCKNVTVSAGATCTANASINNGSSDPDGDTITLSQSPPGPYPLGSTTVTLTVNDGSGSSSQCTGTVTVVDTTSPTVNGSVAESSLWPPDHDLINVGLSASATDACDAGLAITVSVFGDEDDEEATGDGNHSPDAKDIASGTLRLRSERKGNADGRVYLIVINANDDASNVGVACRTVVVPKSQSQADKNAVNAQAAQARAYCQANNGAPPPGYFVIGDGPVIGPKQ
jgi:CSLREA domain-containing protein